MPKRDPKTGEIIQKKGPLSWLWRNKKKDNIEEVSAAVDVRAIYLAKQRQEEEEKRKIEFMKNQMEDSSAIDVSGNEIAENARSFHAFKSAVT